MDREYGGGLEGDDWYGQGGIAGDMEMENPGLDGSEGEGGSGDTDEEDYRGEYADGDVIEDWPDESEYDARSEALRTLGPIHLEEFDHMLREFSLSITFLVKSLAHRVQAVVSRFDRIKLDRKGSSRIPSNRTQTRRKSHPERIPIPSIPLQGRGYPERARPSRSTPIPRRRSDRRIRCLHKLVCRLHRITRTPFSHPLSDLRLCSSRSESPSQLHVLHPDQILAQGSSSEQRHRESNALPIRTRLVATG